MAIASAIIGGALALGGAALSSRSASKASRRAEAASNYAADRSAEVLQRNYDLSAQALRPWQQSGLRANTMLNDFYGLGETGNSRDAFRRFIENSDYGFQFGQGANAVNSGYAGAGAVKSGAAQLALEDYRQNLQQGYRGEFLTGLGNQQGVGFGAASAQAGVSQNLGNSLSNIYMQQGANNANAALARGQNSFGNTLAGIGGYILGGR